MLIYMMFILIIIILMTIISMRMILRMIGYSLGNLSTSVGNP